MGTAVTAIHIGEDVRGHQIADPHARRPSILHLYRSSYCIERILNGAPQAAELPVAEDTDDPGRINLPVVAGTDRPEPAVSALLLIDAEGHARERVPGEGASIPEAAADAAENVETGPVINRRHGRRSFGVRPGCKIGRQGRSGESRCRDESE